MNQVPIFPEPEGGSPSFPDPNDGPLPPAPLPASALLWPFLIVLFTLIGGGVRDILTIRLSNVETFREQSHLAAVLSNSSLQAKALESMRGDLARLAVTDPVAAQIQHDFFPTVSNPATPPPKAAPGTRPPVPGH